jgi:Zn-dependent peptidase ImmA (M78 family)
MNIEEAGGSNPKKLAGAIHDQLRQLGIDNGRVPVQEIATALDIDEIRLEPVESFEGALVTTPERTTGKILANSQSRPTRRSFTIAHELGHFLNIWHRPMEGDRFVCSKKDIGPGFTSAAQVIDPHQIQESEANSFAIELLIPEYRLDP